MNVSTSDARSFATDGNRQLITWWIIVLLVSAAVVAAGWTIGCRGIPVVQLIAFVSSSLCLLWVVFAAIAARVHPSGGLMSAPAAFADDAPRGSGTVPVQVALFAALMFAVVPAVIESVIIVMRMVYVGVDLTFGAESYTSLRYGFGEEGLWSLATLLLAGIIGYIATQDRRIFVATICVVFGMVIWSALLKPTYRPSFGGMLERSGSTVLLALGLAFTMLVSVALSGRIAYRQRWTAARRRPEVLANTHQDWPGANEAYIGISLFLLVLFAFHLCVPVSMWPGAFRATNLILLFASALSMLAAFVQIGRTWNKYLADTAIALLSVMMGFTAMACLPDSRQLLAERYPQIFGALIIGFSLAATLCGWLADVWEQQLDGGRPWTTTGRLIPRIRRFVFLNISLGLVVGALLAVWPRLRGIATTDDTLSSMLAGMSSVLLLLLATLRAARRARRITYYILTMLAVTVLVGYVLTRLIPFSPEFA